MSKNLLAQAGSSPTAVESTLTHMLEKEDYLLDHERELNYDLPWNPMKIEQRIGRIHRIGQKKEVQIFNFCAVDSLEDYILDILDRKINMFEMVIGEIGMILGRISGEKEFSDIIYDIWVNSETKQEREKSFATLGTKMKRAKTGYQKTRELDDKLFGDAYEL